MLPTLFYFYASIFILGLLIGSFLNCVAYRLEVNQSFLKGRSYCPHCKHTLAWYDLFPVLSFVWLGGKCRYCHEKVSWQYPVVELVTGGMFLLVALTVPWASFIFLAYLLYITASLIVIFIYDVKHYLIPDAVLFPAIIVTIGYQLIFNLHFFLYTSLWASLGATVFFTAIFLVSRGAWMGFGDCKLAILLGLMLGFPGILVGLFLAFFLGAIIGLFVMVLKKKGLKSELPFAPFLITGTFIALLWGQQIVDWYLHFFIF
jgi:prepilin signal peptidase PulO-like enzyme (type II secretory pathway)